MRFNRIGNNGFGRDFKAEQNENWDLLEVNINDLNAPGSVTSEKIAPESVTVEKLAKDVDYQSNALGGAVIGSNFMWDKVATTGLKLNVDEIFIDNQELEYGNKLLVLTVKNTSNYKQLLNTDYPAQAKQGVKIPKYARRYNKVSFALNYKISKFGSTKIQCGLRLSYKDGTYQTVKMYDMKTDGLEHAEVFEQPFDNSKEIALVYIYIQGGNIGDVIKISYVSSWFGNTNSNIFDKTLLQNQIQQIEATLSSVSVRYNWCKEAKNIVQNKPLINEIGFENSEAFKHNGIKRLSVNNSTKTPYWYEFECISSAATPFLRFELNDLIRKLRSIKQSGFKLPTVNFKIELYLPYDASHAIEYQFLSKNKGGSWNFLPSNIITKNTGNQTCVLEMSSEIDDIIDQLDDYLAIYIILKTPLLSQKIFLGWSDSWINDENHVLVDEYFNGQNIISKSIIESALAPALQEKINAHTGTSVASMPKPIKSVFVGDSVTWGDGYLADGYVKVLDQLIRGNQGQFLLSDNTDVTYNGTKSSISNKKFYNEKSTKITGANSSVKFTLRSSEIHICQAVERGIGNTILDVYLNGVLFDTIENKNRRPSGTETKTFTGDGTKLKFDLGRACTYGHTVTVDGVTKVGGLNTQGYGGTIPVSSDFLVIKQNVVNVDGYDEIHHILWFKTAPTNGANISVVQKYGESISYTRSHIGESGALFSDGLESTYGDGSTSFDPANPSTLSSGLDFRYVDSESFISYKFDSVETREIEIKIRGLAPGESGTPYFIFNFVTDYHFEYMNAGIGGYTYKLFDKDTGLTSYRKFMEYEPDVITFLLGTNDDWNAASYSVTQNKVITADELTNNSYYWYGSVTDAGNGNYNASDRWVDTSRITKYTVKLADDVTVGTVSKGDILIVNKWTNDERYCQVRLVDSYDVSTKTIKFTTPLNLNSLPDNSKGMVKSINQYKTNLMSVLSKVQTYNPKIPIHLIGMGVPNMNHRQLLGYREVIKSVANSQGWNFTDLYIETSRYLATNKRDKSYTVTSTGAKTYLVDSKLSPVLRNVRVTVDGKQIEVGKEVFITGGYGYYYNSDLTYGYATKPTKITFAIPPINGAVIKVEGTTANWSTDYTHMNNNSGKYIYGEGIYKSIKQHF
ncbi:SGNH/GDSL hydrolase family protein [Bacillus mycoides]|uniref:SGNH/GDSL hydrolase family protein n=1 Tax=Bacillus mycoides TaxID=1405 RepID=UPI0003E2BE12|nr:SGNH/GDSL hydrolase family protein [Bacillus mycoides]ETT85595.1 hypothetical protein C174_01894 [Bacillus mycoides FSL H7-687]